MNHWIGTSGFQYREWKGKFYPDDLSPAKMLAYYSERFPSTEINATFRRVPTAAALQQWSDSTPEKFRFSFKAPQKITHFAKLRDCVDSVQFFASAIASQKDKLGAVLFQLPPTFKKDEVLLREFLQSMPRAIRPAFEFRHESWFADDVFDALRSNNAALCIAESEDLGTPFEATADFGYLRPRREDYTEATLQRWAEFVRRQASRWTDAYIYFKHEEQAVGPAFARLFSSLL
jgi:uncharacterized protein YecE (DUF72 family)